MRGMSGHTVLAVTQDALWHPEDPPTSSGPVFLGRRFGHVSLFGQKSKLRTVLRTVEAGVAAMSRLLALCALARRGAAGGGGGSGGGCGGGAHLRTYFSVPVPRIERSDVEAMVRGRRGTNRPGAKPLGTPLNEFEVLVRGRARVDGWARLDKHCGVALCDAYLRFCYGVRRPYIAVASRGHRVVVDLRPVAGFGAAAGTPAAAAALAALRASAGASLQAAGMSFVNHELPLRVDEEAPARDRGLDGSNEGKRADAEPVRGRGRGSVCACVCACARVAPHAPLPPTTFSCPQADAFTVLPPSATRGKEWARAFYEAFASDNGRLTRADVEARRAHVAAARHANIRRRMFARTDALVADPVRVKFFPPGTFDGCAPRLRHCSLPHARH